MIVDDLYPFSCFTELRLVIYIVVGIFGILWYILNRLMVLKLLGWKKRVDRYKVLEDEFHKF